jgi:hypothetical protein
MKILGLEMSTCKKISLLIQFNETWIDAIDCSPIDCNPIDCNAVDCKPIDCNAIECNTKIKFMM